VENNMDFASTKLNWIHQQSTEIGMSISSMTCEFHPLVERIWFLGYENAVYHPAILMGQL